MNLSNLDDTELWNLLQNGEEDSYTEIYNRYWKALYYTANNILDNQALASDAVQEVFLGLWKRRKGEPIQFLKAYLQQAIRHQVYKIIRDQKVDEEFYTRLAEVTSDMFFENQIILKEQEVQIASILNTLPADCLEIFKMNREEQLTYKQIARRLDISEKTVEKKMTISLKHIRSALAQNVGLCLVLLTVYLCN